MPGDVRGLPVGTAFAADAIEAGEGILIGVPGAEGTGLIPQWESEDTLQWTVYSAPIPATTGIDMSLGEAEFAMREAVRDAADALMRLHTTGLGSGDADPRELIEAELADYSRHDYPESIPLRARRILDSADHVAAILTVAQREPASSPPPRAPSSSTNRCCGRCGMPFGRRGWSPCTPRLAEPDSRRLGRAATA